jgi:ankyrin repeat protein
MGIVAIVNAGDMQKFNLAVQPAEKRIADEVNIASMRFFEAASPSYTNRKFVSTFIRPKTHYVACQIDMRALKPPKKATRYSVLVLWHHPGCKLDYSEISLVDLSAKTPAKSVIFYYGTLKGNTLIPGEYTVKAYVNGIQLSENKFNVQGEYTVEEMFDCKNDQELRKALQRGMDPNGKTSYGWPLIWKAVSEGTLEQVRMLLESGASADVENDLGKTALYQTIFKTNDNIEKASFLVKHGADVNHKNKNSSVLLEALKYGSLFDHYFLFAEFLIRHGADVNARFDYNQETLLHYLSNSSAYSPAIKFLLEHGADPNAKDARGKTPLVDAINRQKYNSAALLLKGGASVKIAVPGYGTKPKSILFLAFDKYLSESRHNDSHGKQSSLEIVRLLVEYGADLLPEEGMIVFEGDIPIWLDHSFMAKIIERNDALLAKAAKVDDPEIRNLVINRLLEKARKKMESSTSDTDLRYAYSLCAQANDLSEKNYVKIISKTQVAINPETNAPRIGLGLLQRYDVFTNKNDGVYILAVSPGMPAALAGIQRGDIMLEFNGQSIMKPSDLPKLVSALEPGRTYPFVVLRQDANANPVIPLYCGLLKWQLGKERQASFYLERYLDLKPDAPNAGEIRTLIKELSK